MTPIEIAGVFATIISLIGQFKQEGKGKHSDFIQWLEYHRHEEIKNLIANNGALQTEVVSFLQQDTQTILSKIDELSRVLQNVATGIQEFRGIASALPASGLHTESINLLGELVAKDWKKFGFSGRIGAPDLWIINGRCEPFDANSDFLEQDLDALASMGFLNLSFDSRGGKVFALTRSAVKLFPQNSPGPEH